MLPHQKGFTALERGVSFNHAAIDKYKYQQPLPLQNTLFPFHQLQSTAPIYTHSPSYLALMTFGQATYSYNLKQLSFLNYHAQYQDTEPFWNQYDLVDQYSQPPHQYPTFGYTHYNYLYDPFSMQDFVPVFIGSNTANGKVMAAGESSTKRGKGRGKYNGDPLMKPFGRVNVYIGDTPVEPAELKDLIRFSKTIGAKFLKEHQKKEGKAEPSSYEKLGFTVELTRLQDGSREVKLINSQSKIWASPPAWAFGEVLGWMQSVRSLPRDAELPQFVLSDDPEQYDLHSVVDVYAATVTLDLRPKPIVNALRGHIIRNLAYTPTTADDFQYLHEHLPVGDVVLKKMIDTFFMHGERNHYGKPHLKREVTAIQKYVNECEHEEFNEWVAEIMEKRNEATLARNEAEKGKGKKGTKSKGKGAKVAAHEQSNIKSEVDVVNGSGKENGRPQTPPTESKLSAELWGDSPKDSAVGSSPKESNKDAGAGS